MPARRPMKYQGFVIPARQSDLIRIRYTATCVDDLISELKAASAVAEQSHQDHFARNAQQQQS